MLCARAHRLLPSVWIQFCVLRPHPVVLRGCLWLCSGPPLCSRAGEPFAVPEIKPGWEAGRASASTLYCLPGPGRTPVGRILSQHSLVFMARLKFTAGGLPLGCLPHIRDFLQSSSGQCGAGPAPGRHGDQRGELRSPAQIHTLVAGSRRCIWWRKAADKGLGCAVLPVGTQRGEGRGRC